MKSISGVSPASAQAAAIDRARWIPEVAQVATLNKTLNVQSSPILQRVSEEGIGNKVDAVA